MPPTPLTSLEAWTHLKHHQELAVAERRLTLRRLLQAELGDIRVCQTLRGWVTVDGANGCCYWIGSRCVARIAADGAVRGYCIHPGHDCDLIEKLLAFVVLLQSPGGETRFHRIANLEVLRAEQIGEMAYELGLYWQLLTALESVCDSSILDPNTTIPRLMKIYLDSPPYEWKETS